MKGEKFENKKGAVDQFGVLAKVGAMLTHAVVQPAFPKINVFLEPAGDGFTTDVIAVYQIEADILFSRKGELKNHPAVIAFLNGIVLK